MKTTNTIMRVHLVMDTFVIFAYSLPQACNSYFFQQHNHERYTCIAMCSLQHVPMNYISVFSQQQLSNIFELSYVPVYKSPRVCIHVL